MAPLIHVVDTTISEADPFTQLVVSVSAPTAQTVTGNYVTGNGTAENSRDHLSTSEYPHHASRHGIQRRPIRLPDRVDPQ